MNSRNILRAGRGPPRRRRAHDLFDCWSLLGHRHGNCGHHNFQHCCGTLPAVRAGGAVTTQNVTDPSIGPEVLALMASGISAVDAVARVMDGRAHAAYRQVAAVDLQGRVAHVTGDEILGINAVFTGAGCVAAGNLLSTTDVPKAMIKVLNPFIRDLGERLLAARRGLRLVVRRGQRIRRLSCRYEQSWRLLTCVSTDGSCPGTCGRCGMYKPQMTPTAVPSTVAAPPGVRATNGVWDRHRHWSRGQ